MQTFGLDIRCAWRALTKSPSYSAGVVAALALAIAGTTLTFAVVHAVLLKPLPFADPDSLVWIWATRTDRDKAFFSVPDFLDYQRANRTLQGVAAYASWGVNLTGAGNPERLQGVRVTPDAFAMLGVTAAVGRPLSPTDADPSASRTVVIAHGLWLRRFGGRQEVVGTAIQLNGDAYTIAGVLQEDFLFPGVDAEVFAPLVPARDPRRTERGSNFLRVFARLPAGGTIAQVRDEWGRISRELRQAYPDENAKKLEPRVLPLTEEMLGANRRALGLLMAGVLGVWLLACTNILNLELMRLLAREREAAIRGALGASATGLAAPQLLESTMLVCAGGLLGTILTILTLPVFRAAVPLTLPRAATIHFNATGLAFACGLVLVTLLVVAVLPAIRQARGISLEAALRRTIGTAAPSSRRARNVLVVFEIAAALCLLLTTTFLLKGYHELQSLDPGVRRDGLIQTRVSLPARHATPPALERFVTLALEEIGRIPGVADVAAANALPLAAQNIRTDFAIVSRPAASPGDVAGAQNRWVTAGYFETVGIQLVEGRTFTAADATARAPVAIVDEALAERFWPDRTAIGDRVRILDGSPQGRVLEIVGIVRNVPHFDIGEQPLGTLYGPIQQIPPSTAGFFASSFMIAVSITGDAERAGREILDAIRRVDPEIPTTAPWTMADQLRRVLAARRFVAIVLTLFAGSALLLAISGVYSVVSTSMREQTRELAIRIALGASRATILSLVLGLAGRLLAVGIPLGLLLTVVLSRLAAIEAGTRVGDWTLWAPAPLMLGCAALAASHVRARRVLRLDPALTLRAE